MSIHELEEANRCLQCKKPMCREGCPIHQDVPEYLHLMEKGRAPEALALIARRNPLPFITGTICAHNCMSKCTRRLNKRWKRPSIPENP